MKTFEVGQLVRVAFNCDERVAGKRGVVDHIAVDGLIAVLVDGRTNTIRFSENEIHAYEPPAGILLCDSLQAAILNAAVLAGNTRTKHAVVAEVTLGQFGVYQLNSPAALDGWKIRYVIEAKI